MKPSWELALEEVRARGGVPYAIPAGASDHRLGGLGFANWADEVREQEQQLGVFFDTIIVCSVTGSTHAGMIAGFAFQATASRAAFRLLLGRENPRLTRDQIEHIYDASRSWATKRAVLKLYRATPEATLASPAAALRQLDRPALVIWGTQDTYLPSEQAERQREAFPSAQVELLEGHGHWVMLEDPARVASLVIPFLRRQLPDPATATGSSASPPPGP